MDKKITVIVPCYNVENYIDRCLTSITQQTIGIENLQIICVNDASTDNTLTKLNQWQQRYPMDIRIIDCKENGRQGRARNLALHKTVTPYVGFVDSDDWIELDMYEKMYEKALVYDCDIVYCGSSRDKENVPFDHTKSSKNSWLLTIDNKEERKKFITANSIGFNCWDKLIQTDFIRKNNIYFPEKLAYEDIFFGSLLYLYAEKICLTEDQLYHYFVNESSTVLTVNQPYHKDIFIVNDLKWQAAKERGFLDDYSKELEYDYLITGYLSILKILVLRYTTDTYEDYLRLYETVTKRIPNFAQNPYLYQLPELSQLQIQLLQKTLTKTEWIDFCNTIKALS